MTSSRFRICPNCGGKFPYYYWGSSGRAGDFGTDSKKFGIAEYNYNRHIKSCGTKKPVKYRMRMIKKIIFIGEYNTQKNLSLSCGHLVPKHDDKPIVVGDKIRCYECGDYNILIR